MTKLVEVPQVDPAEGILIHPDHVVSIKGDGPKRSILSLSGGDVLDIKLGAEDLAKHLGFGTTHYSAP